MLLETDVLPEHEICLKAFNYILLVAPNLYGYTKINSDGDLELYKLFERKMTRGHNGRRQTWPVPVRTKACT